MPALADISNSPRPAGLHLRKSGQPRSTAAVRAAPPASTDAEALLVRSAKPDRTFTAELEAGRQPADLLQPEQPTPRRLVVSLEVCEPARLECSKSSQSAPLLDAAPTGRADHLRHLRGGGRHT